MRKPSRFMPPAKSIRNVPMAAISSAIIASFSLLLLYRWPIQLLTLALILAFVSKVFKFLDRRHFRALAKKRISGPQALGTFAKTFNCRAIDTWVIRAVYEELQVAIQSSNSFPLYSTDRLIEDLKLDFDDLEFEVGQRISQRTGRSLQKTTCNPYYHRVNSVRDLVLFFNAQPLEGEAT